MTETGKDEVVYSKADVVPRVAGSCCAGLCCGEQSALWVDPPTHIPASIVALLLGIASTAIGLTPERTLERSNSFGIAMAGVIAIVMAPLITASLSDVFAAIVPMLVILVVGFGGIMLGGFIATKLLRWKSGLGMSVALTAMYGFPADYLLTSEVARSVGRNETERSQLSDAMLPPMLVGGFTSVTSGSVVIASVLVSFI